MTLTTHPSKEHKGRAGGMRQTGITARHSATVVLGAEGIAKQDQTGGFQIPVEGGTCFLEPITNPDWGLPSQIPSCLISADAAQLHLCFAYKSTSHGPHHAHLA